MSLKNGFDTALYGADAIRVLHEINRVLAEEFGNERGERVGSSARFTLKVRKIMSGMDGGLRDLVNK